MKKKFPFMSIPAEEWLASTSSMTAKEKGHLFDLYCHLWLNHAYLPDDDYRIAIRMKLTLRQWLNLREKFKPLLRIENDLLTIPTLLENYDRSQSRSKKRSESGTKGAANRWNNNGA